MLPNSRGDKAAANPRLTSQLVRHTCPRWALGQHGRLMLARGANKERVCRSSCARATTRLLACVRSPVCTRLRALACVHSPACDYSAAYWCDDLLACSPACACLYSPTRRCAGATTRLLACPYSPVCTHCTRLLGGARVRLLAYSPEWCATTRLLACPYSPVCTGPTARLHGCPGSVRPRMRMYTLWRMLELNIKFWCRM